MRLLRNPTSILSARRIFLCSRASLPIALIVYTAKSKSEALVSPVSSADVTGHEIAFASKTESSR